MDSLQTIVGDFADFRLLDTGKWYRLEQWAGYRLARPDPQIIWERHLPEPDWTRADATFESSGEGGRWRTRHRFPPTWPVKFRVADAQKDILLHARLTAFKHTGIFAEQSANWAWMAARCAGKQRRILNLFGYTGAATIVLSCLG